MPARLDADVAVAVMRTAGLEPIEPYPGSAAPWLSRCLGCGREVKPRLGGIRNGQGGCHPCAMARFGASMRLDPDEAAQNMRATGLEPLEPYPGSVDARWRCLCLRCGSEVTPDLKGIRRGRGGCKYCAGNSTTDPDEAAQDMRAAGLEPLEPYPGNNKAQWLCRCQGCGQEVRPRLNSIRNGQGGCKQCGDARAGIDRRGPADVAAAAMREAGLEPLEPFRGLHVPWRCRCLGCGRESTPRLVNIRSGQGGCKPCGYRNMIRDPDARVALYLVRHAGWRAVKVGIGRDERIREHVRNGWTVERVWRDLEPRAAYTAEEAALAAWRLAGIPDAVPAEAMPQGGHTETAPADLVDLGVTRRIITEVIRLELAPV